jgi:large subunit ribosomal protein L24e
LSAAQAAQKRKLEERRALIEAKKVKLLGGREAVERLRAERRAAEVDSFLQSIDTELGNAEGKGSGSRDASS